MKNFQWKKLLPHVIALVIFALVAAIYCKPALEGKVLQQSDITLWKGAAHNSMQYFDKHGHMPLWTNGIFSGMPAFQLTGLGENPIGIGNLQNVLTLGLPKPISFFFLACICFYFLSQILNVNPYIGIIGSLGYAYATYNPIIITAGHETKMIAIAYIPAMIGSILLVFNKKYLSGAAFTAMFTALLVGANHPQISYYTLLIVAFMSIGFAIQWIQEKDFKHLFTALSTAGVAALIGVLVNAVVLFTTYEYAQKTIRGGSALADNKDVTKTGLSNDYALSYSIYKTEPLVMMFPRMYGGSSHNLEIAEDKSKTIEALQQMPQQLAQNLQNNGFLSFYWGGIDGVGTAGPPYVGAIICFLALIGFVILDKKYKWWILAATVCTLLMSWGKYFEGFNLALLKYLPMYNKFRAPSMILVVPTFLFALMAILTIQKIVNDENKEELIKKYKKGLLLVAGVFFITLLIYLSSDFSGEADKLLSKQIATISDAQQKEAIAQPVKAFINGLKEDRQSLFLGDIFRTFIFCFVAAMALWLHMKKKMNTTIVLAIIGVFAFVDVITIDGKYLNSDQFQEEAETDNILKPSPSDVAILKDTSYYRIFNITQGISAAFNSGSVPSYFHKNIGGYHPAKLSIYQDLIEKQFANFPNCMPVINMLNTKYIIQGNIATDTIPNPNALGACWFVKGIRAEKGPKEIMNALSNFNPKDTAIVESSYAPQIHTSNDTTGNIKLVYNDNDIAEYTSNAASEQFAVFSEIYYDKGWFATIDGKEASIVPVNYVLRGLQIPGGNHKIVFEFKPASYYTGNKITVASSAIVWLLLLGAIAEAVIKRRKQTTV